MRISGLVAREMASNPGTANRKYTTISDALSGEEATGDHRAADHEKDPLEARL